MCGLSARQTFVVWRCARALLRGIRVLDAYTPIALRRASCCTIGFAAMGRCHTRDACAYILSAGVATPQREIRRHRAVAAARCEWRCRGRLAMVPIRAASPAATGGILAALGPIIAARRTGGRAISGAADEASQTA